MSEKEIKKTRTPDSYPNRGDKPSQLPHFLLSLDAAQVKEGSLYHMTGTGSSESWEDVFSQSAVSMFRLECKQSVECV